MAETTSPLPQLTLRPAPRLITGGVIWAGTGRTTRAVDLRLRADGIIDAIAPAGSLEREGEVLDLSGDLISPAFLDCHQHLDKTLSLPFTPNPSGTLLGAIQSFGRHARDRSRDEIRQRALSTIARCLRQGTTAIRSHVNADPDTGMEGLEVLAQIRDELGDLVTIQIVSFLTSGATKDLDWLQRHAASAARMGDVIGGTPAIATDPQAYLDCLFRTAAETGRSLDLHMDEHLDPEKRLFDAVLDRVEAYGMQGRVVLGHCSVLSAMAGDAFNRIRDRLARLDAAVVTLPAANLYLQARDAEKLPPRGLTRIRELLDGGVTVAAASDNIQDPFVPTGTGDMAEMARWTLLAGQLFADDLGRAFDMVTRNAAQIMGLKGHGEITIGQKARLVISDAPDPETLVAAGTMRRRVITHGRMVG